MLLQRMFVMGVGSAIHYANLNYTWAGRKLGIGVYPLRFSVEFIFEIEQTVDSQSLPRLSTKHANNFDSVLRLTRDK